MLVTALATKEILTTIFSTSIKGLILSGTYLVSDKLVTHVYPENEGNRLFRNVVGPSALTLAATGTGFLVKYLLPSTQHLYYKGIEPFDRKASTLKEVIEIAGSSNDIKQIIEFIEKNYESVTEDRVYLINCF
ncbi:MAG: hypothetical protein H0W50_03200 [Parachlamydiaceae bacterium]|nr:hypothetical protein [Parachlamydiaceae bacterium]